MTRPMLLALVTTASSWSRTAPIPSRRLPRFTCAPGRAAAEAPGRGQANQRRGGAEGAGQAQPAEQLGRGADRGHAPADQPCGRGLEPYGEVSVTYNLASRAIDRTWTARSTPGPTGKGGRKRRRAGHGGAAQTGRGVDRRPAEAAEISRSGGRGDREEPATGGEGNYGGSGLSQSACVDRLLLGIESGDASYRLGRLQEFLNRNF